MAYGQAHGMSRTYQNAKWSIYGVRSKNYIDTSTVIVITKV